MTTPAAGEHPARPMEAVELRRVLPDPPEHVFRAWTDPDLIRQWMSLGAAEAEVDLRVGGRFRILMRGEGVEIDHTGEYVEVEPPERLVFTWRSPYTGDEPSVVAVVLRAVDEGTELVLTHQRLPHATVESHGEGWGLLLDRLTHALAETRER